MKRESYNPMGDGEELEAERERAHDNAEYDRGRADYDRWKFNTRFFGEDYAAAEELAWEMKLGSEY